MPSGGEMKKTLKDILQALIDDLGQATALHNPLNIDLNNHIIEGDIKTDSKNIKKGDIFACIKGLNVDGHSFASEVVKKGADILIVETIQDINITQILVNDTRKATAILARVLYDNPTTKFDLIGITGTNGKTSTTNILEQLFQKSGYKTGLIGTLGYKIGDEYFASERTTPDIVELNEIFVKMVKAECQIVFMEVSSHALALDRVYGLNFKIGIFTNLSQDHLDFHKDMEDYGKAKLKLFEMVEASKGLCIINTDDGFGEKIYNQINGNKMTFGDDKNNHDWSISNISLTPELSKFDLKSEAHIYQGIRSPLIGKFNIYNLTAALIVAHKYKIDINSPIEYIHSPLGRMERVPNNKDIDIYIDYAHTPEALSTVLDTVREFTQKRVICLFGCGGNRDKEKRSQMARISVQKADLSIITNDNPRFEFPADIIRDIVEPLSFSEEYFIIRDRGEAIKATILLAQKGDTVIVAGKGHENYQEIEGIKYHFDDREEIAKCVAEMEQSSCYSEGKLSIPIDLLNIEKLLNITIDNELLSDNKPLFTSISTDSRNANENTLFFAIKGERYDGADYVEEVLKKSDKNWAIKQITNDKSQLINDKKTFEFKAPVSDFQFPIYIYGMLAQKYLSLFGTKTIAITGSTGKTTTKEILYNILSTKHKTFQSHANENNQIGVPKNIFKMRPEYEYAIFEIGTSGQGEIAYLSNILQPDVGGVISVNASHLEFLKSVENIRKEKMSLVDCVKDFAIVPFFSKDAEGKKQNKVYTFGWSNTADFHIIESNLCEKGLYISLKSDFIKRDKMSFQTSIKLPFLAENIAFSIALSKILSIDDETIEIGLQKELSLKNRMEIFKSKGNQILFDCYNANPCSMKAAIEFWSKTEPEHTHIAILGDMLELGEKSEEYHQEIGKQLQNIKKSIDKDIIQIIGIGNLSRCYSPDYHFENVDSFMKNETIPLREIFTNEGKELYPKVILIKGSNSINLIKLKERI